MLLDKFAELHKVLLMQSFQITFVYTLAILSKMGSRPVLFQLCFGGGIVFLKTRGIVADKIDPGTPALSSSTNQRAIMARGRETHFKKGIRQSLGVHLFIKINEGATGFKGFLPKEKVASKIDLDYFSRKSTTTSRARGMRKAPGSSDALLVVADFCYDIAYLHNLRKSCSIMPVIDQ